MHFFHKQRLSYAETVTVSKMHIFAFCSSEGETSLTSKIQFNEIILQPLIGWQLLENLATFSKNVLTD